jgi:RNase P subunit RPR2
MTQLKYFSEPAAKRVYCKKCKAPPMMQESPKRNHNHPVSKL